MSRREFVHAVRVRPPHCDRQGVVNHAVYLEFFEAALIELWREALGPYGETVADHGMDLAVAETNVRYLAPARFDDVVEVAGAVRRMGTTALVVGFEATVAGAPVARGETRYVSVADGAKRPLPDPIRKALADYREEHHGTASVR